MITSERTFDITYIRTSDRNPLVTMCQFVSMFARARCALQKQQDFKALRQWRQWRERPESNKKTQLPRLSRRTLSQEHKGSLGLPLQLDAEADAVHPEVAAAEGHGRVGGIRGHEGLPVGLGAIEVRNPGGVDVGVDLVARPQDTGPDQRRVADKELHVRRDVVADGEVYFRHDREGAGLPGADVAGQSKQAAVECACCLRRQCGGHILLAEDSDRLIRVTVSDLNGAVEGPGSPAAVAGNANLHAIEIVTGAEAVGRAADDTVARGERQVRVAEVFGDLQLLIQAQVAEADQEVDGIAAAAAQFAAV